ncbi:MAG: hypothetical protein DRN04_03515 [Thermoprotei archaeon]|nr:MAG: hypothetical protein DRN04_03515 [Thermoprotei archaeon]
MNKTANKPFYRQRTPYNIILEAIYLYSSRPRAQRQVAKELEKRGVKRIREAIRKGLKLKKRPEPELLLLKKPLKAKQAPEPPKPKTPHKHNHTRVVRTHKRQTVFQRS